MRSRIRPYVMPVAAAAAIVACLYACSPNFRYTSGPAAGPYAGDFLQEWLGGWIVRNGDLTRFYDVPYAYGLQHDERLVGFAWNADEYLPIVYPPFYYLVISPLSLVPFHVAAWLWAGLMTAALVVALWLLASLFPDPFSRRSQIDASTTSGRGLNKLSLLPWLIPAAVLFTPVLESLSSSQKGTLCLLILTGTFALWNCCRPLTAGMVFGLLAFKPQLVLVIVACALWKRQWRFVAGGAMTGAALAGLSLLMGIDVCQQYVRFALGAGQYMQTSGYDLYKSHSVWGFAALLFGTDGGLVAKALGLALAGLVVWQLSNVLRGRLAPGSDRFGMQFAALVVTTVLLAPHLFTYDLTILLLPMALVVGQYARRGKGSSSLALRVSVWVTALLYVAPAISTGIAAATGLQLTLPLMMLYLAVLARLAVRQRQPGATTRFDARLSPRAAAST